MKQQPDKLFRDKLEHYQRTAPVSAWDRIDADLDKKTHKGLWLKIAASLLIIVLASYWLWPASTPRVTALRNSKTNDTLTLYIKKNKTTSTLVAVIPSETKQNLNSIQSKKHQAGFARINKAVITPIEKENVEVQKELNEDVTMVTTSVTAQFDTLQTKINIDVAVATEPSNNSTTLIYTAEDVNKYLTNNSEAQATSDEQKPSTFKRLLNKAYGLKTNQDPLGELRQKKNEILALNFKKEKRGQNK